jgi:hypothetical protein
MPLQIISLYLFAEMGPKVKKREEVSDLNNATLLMA